MGDFIIFQCSAKFRAEYHQFNEKCPIFLSSCGEGVFSTSVTEERASGIDADAKAAGELEIERD